MSDVSVKIVDVVTDELFLSRRQLPLAVEESLKLVLQFENVCLGCHLNKIHQKGFDQFLNRFNNLTNDELTDALVATSAQLNNVLQQMISCVGCRKGADSLFQEIAAKQYGSLDPFVVSEDSVVSISGSSLDAKTLYSLFYLHGPKFNSVVESCRAKSKRIRCSAHSLDSQKPKGGSTWRDLWEIMSEEVHDVVMTVDCDALLATIDMYLTKHRFCAECKSQVLLAYSLLVGEVEPTKYQSFSAQLYEGIKFCSSHNHIHISYTDLESVQKLILRAVPELLEVRRERHAKTIEVAQEEILTCLGFHIHDRLHRIWTKCRIDTQIWHVLFNACTEVLRRNLEAAFDSKDGVTDLEQVCEEFDEMDRRREQKRERKKQKKRERKTAKESARMAKMASSPATANSNSPRLDHVCPGSPASAQQNSDVAPICSTCKCARASCSCAKVNANNGKGKRKKTSASLANDSTSVSKESIADSKSDSEMDGKSTANNSASSASESPKLLLPKCIYSGTSESNSLESMLAAATRECADAFIPTEEILRFKACEKQTCAQRQKLRENLRAKFAVMQSNHAAGRVDMLLNCSP